MNKEIKIGWIISHDFNMASSRLQGFLINEQFKEQGYTSDIIASDFEKSYNRYSLEFIKLIIRIIKSGYEIVFFVKPNWMMFKMSEFLILNNIKTIAVRCDYYENEYDKYFTTTLVPTKSLCNKLQLKDYEIVDDMIEVPSHVYKKNYRQSIEKLKIVWVGNEEYKNFILDFSKKIMSDKTLNNKIEINTISSGEWPSFQWNINSVHDLILQSDIAIIPFPNGERYQIKSTNRLTMMMALGMPTIVSPIDSYSEIAKEGTNCLTANTIDEFVTAILKLHSLEVREKIGQNSRKFSRANYNPSVVWKKWLEVVLKIHSAPHKKLPSKIHTKIINIILTLRT